MKNILNLFSIPISMGDPVAPAPHFQKGSALVNSKTLGAKHLIFDVREIAPGKLGVPYHFHDKNEELFVILSGEATLRQANRRFIVREGDLIFFQTGPEGAHQLYNHSAQTVRYLDIVSSVAGDICEYPDSGKVNFGRVFRVKDEVEYFDGEASPPAFWNELNNE